MASVSPKQWKKLAARWCRVILGKTNKQTFSTLSYCCEKVLQPKRKQKIKSLCFVSQHLYGNDQHLSDETNVNSHFTCFPVHPHVCHDRFITSLSLQRYTDGHAGRQQSLHRPYLQDYLSKVRVVISPTFLPSLSSTFLILYLRATKRTVPAGRRKKKMKWFSYVYI